MFCINVMNFKRNNFSKKTIKTVFIIFLSVIILLFFLKFRVFFNENLGLFQAILTTALITVTSYYAWQTKATVNEMAKQTNLQQRPLIKISDGEEWACSFMLRNIGRGTALNVELKISQIYPKGGFTNLRNLAEDEQRELFNLGSDEEQSTTSFCVILDDYRKAEKSEYNFGVKGVFAVIALYEDLDKNSYYTIALFKVRSKYNDYILKTTKTGDHKYGELEKVIPLEWLK